MQDDIETTSFCLKIMSSSVEEKANNTSDLQARMMSQGIYLSKLMQIIISVPLFLKYICARFLPVN